MLTLRRNRAAATAMICLAGLAAGATAVAPRAGAAPARQLRLTGSVRIAAVYGSPDLKDTLVGQMSPSEAAATAADYARQYTAPIRHGQRSPGST